MGRLTTYLSQSEKLKNMNLSNKAMFKGLLIGFGLMAATEVGVFELLMKLI